MSKTNKTAEIMREAKNAAAIMREMDVIQKRVEHLAYKLNWQSSKADEQPPLSEQFRKWAAYRNSNFIQAGEVLFSHYEPDRDTVTVDEYAAIQQIALYYFATNKDIDPTQQGGIGEAEKAALLAYLDSITAAHQNSPRLTLEQVTRQTLGIPAQKRRTKTQSKGITETYERVVSITDKDFQWALTPYQGNNGEPYIARLDEETYSKLVFKNGAISFLDSRANEDDIRKATETSIAKDIDVPLLRHLFTVIYHNAKEHEGSRVRVYLPAFCKGMGIDMAKGNPYDVFSKFDGFRNLVGFTARGIHSVLTFSEYDAETNDLLFDSPYLYAIYRQIGERQPVMLNNGKTYQKPAYSYLVHSNIAKERNKDAVEIVHAIIALLHQRGGVSAEQIANNREAAKECERIKKRVRAEKASSTTVTARKAFAAIVKEIPSLQDYITTTKNQANINKKLNRAFSKAYDLLRNKTDAYEYFIGLEVSDIIPTATTLDRVLATKHQGINAEYKTRM